MKFEDLTDEDLLDINPDNEARWVDLICADLGLPLLPTKPTDRPKTVPLLKTDTALEVEAPYGLYYPASSRQEVEKAVNALNSLRSLTTKHVNGYSGPCYLKDSDGMISVKPFSFYTRAEAIEATDAQDAIAQELDEYNKAETAYNAAVKARQETVDRVRNAIQLANDKYAAYLALSKSWDKYLDLADGNEEVADKFFISYYGKDKHRRIRPGYYMAETSAVIEDEL